MTSCLNISASDKRHLKAYAQSGLTGQHQTGGQSLISMIALLYARRCKKLEQMPCSAAVLQSVGMQAIVTEFLIKNADTLFSDAAQNGTNDVTAGQSSDVSDTRVVLPSCKYYWSIIICPPLHGHPG